MQNLEYGVVKGSEVLTEGSSAKCYSVWKPNANLLDTLVALSSAFKYFQMLPAPPLELSKVHSGSARAFSHFPGSICFDEGAFRMLRD
jgi:hypothetical protein